MAITLRLVKGSELTYAEGDANITTLQAADVLALPKAGGSLTGALNEAPTVTVASSATPAIFSAAGNSISLTGTTTVAGFDTIAAGAVRRVVFAGVLQLTNGANLINISGANIVTAAGDVAMFLSQGAGVTLMVSYTRASGAALVGSGSTPLVNDLVTGGTTSGLAAQQGPAIKALIDANTTAIGTKQATLLSGTNIRTVNGNTLLGSTDLVIAGGVPNQTGALAASATAAPVADTVIAALATKATAGLVTTVALTTHTLVAADIGTLQQQQGVSALTLSIDTAANSGITWVAGKVFAVGSVNTGAVALAALAGVTIVNIGAKAVVQDDTPLVVQMSPTVNRWLVL